MAECNISDPLLNEQLREASQEGHNEEVSRLLLNGAHVDSTDENGWSSLMWASVIGHDEVVKTLLSAGAQINLQDEYGRSSLMLASFGGHEETVKTLLSAGAQVNLQNKYGWSSLMWASEKGHEELVKTLLSAGAQVNLQNKDGRSSLMWASQEGHKKVVKILLSAGAQVNPQDKDGWSSLMWASQVGHEEVVKTLLSAGAQVNLQNKDGRSSLMWASKKGHEEIVKTLLSAGAQVNLQNKNGWSSLMWASQGGHEEVVKTLLSAGAQVNLQNKYEVSSLILASGKGHEEVVKTLLSAAAQVNVQNIDGWSSLMVASQEGREEVVKTLLSAGAQINLTNKDGLSSLMWASYKGHAEVVKTLLSASAQINLTNKDGSSSLMWASQGGHEEVVKTLLSAGAQVNLQNKYGQSSLMLACREGHEEVVKTLLSAGDQVNLQDKDGMTALHHAAGRSHGGCVGLLMSAPGIDVNLVNKDGRTPLELATSYEVDGLSLMMWASKEGHEVIVKTLVSAGTRVDLQDENGLSSLMLASMRGHGEVVKTLLSASAQINLTNKNGCSSLMLASHGGHEEVVKSLLSAGAQVNLQDLDGKPSLMLASERGHKEIVKTLISSGAQVDLQDEDGRSSLMLASEEGHEEVVKTLLFAGAQVNLKDKYYGRSSLMLASVKGHEEVVKALLSAGAQVNQQNKYGDTALHRAAQSSRGGCVRLLMSAPGIDANLVNNEGKTPLELAISYEVLTILKTYTNIYKDFPVHTYGKVIVCGDSGAGKTTLTHTIMDCCKSTSKGSNNDQNLSEKRKHVKSLTAGIISHSVKSPKVNMTVYDLAGHREYYSSHSSILEHISTTTPSVFLLLVNLLLPLKEITSQLYYWSAMIGNVSNKCPQQSSIIVVGTHADCISDERKLQFLSSQIEQVARDATKHHIFVQVSALDVSSFSQDLDSLMSLLCHTVDDVRVRCPAISLDCHVMYAFLNDKVPANQDAISLTELLVLLKQQTPQVLDADAKEISKLLRLLSEKGFIVFFDTNLADSWIVIHQDTLLEKVNGVLFAPQEFEEHLPIASNTGVIPITVLKKHFPEPKYNIDMMIQFLIRFELCQPISLVPANTTLKGSSASSGPYLFFPPLVQANRPDDVLIHQNALCFKIFTDNINQPLSPRFLHVLMNRITNQFPSSSTQPCLVPDLKPYNRHCTLWSRGISWRSKEGFTCVVEMDEDFQCLSCAVFASDKTDSSYSQLILDVINVLKLTCDEFCPLVSRVEVVMCPPEATSDHISAAVEYELLRDMLHSNKKIVTDRDRKKEVNVKEWLNVEPQLPSLLGVAKQGVNVNVEYKTLGEDDLTDVMEEVVDLADRWKALGLALRLRSADLETIASKNDHNPKDFLRDTLLHWLQCHYDTTRFGPPSWQLLCKAVEARAGGDNPALAKHIKEKNYVEAPSEVSDTTSLLDIECSEDDIYTITEYCFDWRRVGRRLLGEQKVKDIDNDRGNEAEKKEKTLLEWKRVKSCDATFQELVKALQRVEDNTTADLVKKLVKKRK